MADIFDPKVLTDDELFSKHVELMRRRIVIQRIGFGNAAYQLDVMIEAVENERRERMYLDYAKRLPSSPVVVDTDPQPVPQNTADELPKPSTTLTRPIRRPIRSKTPIIPDGA